MKLTSCTTGTLIIVAWCIPFASCAPDQQAQLVDINGAAIDDDYHHGTFWEAMATAGFKRLGSTESNDVRAEIWAIKQRAAQLEVGWIVFTKNLDLPDEYSLGVNGDLVHAADTIPQRSFGQRDKFTLSDRIVVYGRLSKQLMPPSEVWICTQGFQVLKSDLKEPFAVTMILELTAEDRTRTLEFKVKNIPVDAIEE